MPIVLHQQVVVPAPKLSLRGLLQSSVSVSQYQRQKADGEWQEMVLEYNTQQQTQGIEEIKKFLLDGYDPANTLSATAIELAIQDVEGQRLTGMERAPKLDSEMLYPSQQLVSAEQSPFQPHTTQEEVELERPLFAAGEKEELERILFGSTKLEEDLCAFFNLGNQKPALAPAPAPASELEMWDQTDATQLLAIDTACVELMQIEAAIRQHKTILQELVSMREQKMQEITTGNIPTWYH